MGISLLLMILTIGGVWGQSCLHTQKLVAREVTPSEIVKHNSIVCDSEAKHFAGITIGLITPWNANRGKELTLKYAGKFDIVSPFWYQIEFTDGKYLITGAQNYDAGYLSDLRTANRHLRVVPKFSFDDTAISQLYGQNGKEGNIIAELITNYTIVNNFSGASLDTGVYMLQAAMRDYIASLVKELGTRLHKAKLQLVVSIYLHRTIARPIIDSEIFGELDKSVDYFTLLNYEFGHSYLHSPIKWAENAIEEIEKALIRPENLIISIPFYGCEFRVEGPSSKMGATSFASFLDTPEPPFITWDSEAEEHTVTYRKYSQTEKTLETVTVIMPSLYFIDRRLKMCQKKRCGVSIPDVGEGYNYFMAMF